MMMDVPTKRAALDGLANALAPVKSLMDDPLVQEIMINGPNDVWVERQGVQSVVELELRDTAIRNAISVLAKLSGKEAKGGTPNGVIDARLEGFRINAVLPPTAVLGPTICIRKHSPVNLAIEDYVASGAIPSAMGQAMIAMVVGRKNILVAGGTSSGKTTLVNALIDKIPEHERVLTVEDTVELKVRVPNKVRFESNEPAGVTTRLLIKAALRQRPDRIIVGEVRDGAAYDLMQAANTGHDGCIATLHANSAFDALSRMETMILQADVGWPHAAICSQIARTFDYVIFMNRLNGERKLVEIIEVSDYDINATKYVFKSIYKREA